MANGLQVQNLEQQIQKLRASAQQNAQEVRETKNETAPVKDLITFEDFAKIHSSLRWALRGVH